MYIFKKKTCLYFKYIYIYYKLYYLYIYINIILFSKYILYVCVFIDT